MDMNSIAHKFLTTAFLLIAFCFSGKLYSQTLTSDQSDYAPGATVVLTGSGFQAGETVTLLVVHADGSFDNDTSAAHQPWDVVADGDGNFVTTWEVPFDQD